MDRILKGKTRHLTRRNRFGMARTRHQPLGSQVEWLSVQVQSVWPGGLSLRFSWTPLLLYIFSLFHHLQTQTQNRTQINSTTETQLPPPPPPIKTETTTNNQNNHHNHPHHQSQQPQITTKNPKQKTTTDLLDLPQTQKKIAKTTTKTIDPKQKTATNCHRYRDLPEIQNNKPQSTSTTKTQNLNHPPPPINLVSPITDQPSTTHYLDSNPNSNKTQDLY